MKQPRQAKRRRSKKRQNPRLKQREKTLKPKMIKRLMMRWSNPALAVLRISSRMVALEI